MKPTENPVKQPVATLRRSLRTTSRTTFPLALVALLGACDTGDPEVEETATRAYEGGAEVTPAPGASAGEPPVSGTEASAETPEEVVSTLIGRNGEEIGSVILHPHRQGVRLDLHVEGLEPGPHAVHFHQVGACEPPGFESAGGHFAPSGGRHGMPDADEDMNDPDHHAGDMLNQTVNDIGQMDVQLTNQSVSIDGSRNPLLDEDGSALVIHARPDDYETQPAGDAGERVACAELVAVN